MLECMINPNMDLMRGACSAPTCQCSVGFVVSWLIGFGVVDPKNRLSPVPDSILIRPWLWSWFFSGKHPRDWIGAKEHFPAPGSKLDSVLGVMVQPWSDTVLGLDSAVLHPYSLLFPERWARGRQRGKVCCTVPLLCLGKPWLAGRKEAKWTPVHRWR